MGRPRTWTDADLLVAAELSANLKQVCERLGIAVGKHTYQMLRLHLARLGVDDERFRIGNQRRRQGNWTEADLRAAVASSTSVSGVLRTLGYEPNGGMHRYITAKLRTLEIDTSHFNGGFGWSKGMNLKGRRLRPLEEILVRNSDFLGSSNLRERLIAAGLKERRCEECGLDAWRGKPLPLHLDHINGDHCDDRLENLRILCPNCHALTETWCVRKSKPA